MGRASLDWVRACQVNMFQKVSVLSLMWVRVVFSSMLVGFNVVLGSCMVTVLGSVFDCLYHRDSGRACNILWSGSLCMCVHCG